MLPINPVATERVRVARAGHRTANGPKTAAVSPNAMPNDATVCGIHEASPVSYIKHCLGSTKAPEERSQYNGVIAFMAKKFPSESTEPALKFSHPLQEKEGVNAQFWEPGKRQEGRRERGSEGGV